MFICRKNSQHSCWHHKNGNGLKTSHSIHLNETIKTEQISGVLCWNFVDEVFAANLDLFVFRSVC